MRIIVLALFFLLTGCASLHLTPPPPPQRIGLNLAPATLRKSMSLQQHMTVLRDGQTHELDTVLEINPTELNLVGLAFGRRIMTLHYDGKTLTTWRDPHVPSQVIGENVLEDIELTLWPVKVIRHALPIYWTIQQQGNQRTILEHNIPIEFITYYKNNTVMITNLKYNYQITIKSVAN
jgi:hypothetical protein